MATRRPGRVPAEVSTQDILDLYDSGLSMAEVAAQVGLSAPGAWSRYQAARPPKKPAMRLGRWQHVLLAALEHPDAVSVRSAVNVHLGREPNRAELHAALRSAHSLADSQLVRPEHVPGSVAELGGVRRVLVVIRPYTASSDWGSPRLTDTLIADLLVRGEDVLHVEEEEAVHPGVSA